MSCKMVVGNWKMNLDHVEAIHLMQQLGVLLRAKSIENTEVCVAPPFVDLRSVSSVIEADRLAVSVAAQHAHFAENGPFTGEVSVSMLKRLGVKSVIVGHSERRASFGMDNEAVRLTVEAVLRAGMAVVLCCGEDLETREAGAALDFVQGQIESALLGVKSKYADQITLAYEPIWAIGTGRAADAGVVSEMLESIRAVIPADLRAESRILYGGSVSAENAATLITSTSADGFLVGGASLKAEEFIAIISAVDDCYRKER